MNTAYIHKRSERLSKGSDTADYERFFSNARKTKALIVLTPIDPFTTIYLF